MPDEDRRVGDLDARVAGGRVWAGRLDAEVARVRHYGVGLPERDGRPRDARVGARDPGGRLNRPTANVDVAVAAHADADFPGEECVPRDPVARRVERGRSRRGGPLDERGRGLGPLEDDPGSIGSGDAASLGARTRAEHESGCAALGPEKHSDHAHVRAARCPQSQHRDPGRAAAQRARVARVPVRAARRVLDADAVVGAPAVRIDEARSHVVGARAERDRVEAGMRGGHVEGLLRRGRPHAVGRAVGTGTVRRRAGSARANAPATLRASAAHRRILSIVDSTPAGAQKLRACSA
jgi:hypothetical protein